MERRKKNFDGGTFCEHEEFYFERIFVYIEVDKFNFWQFVKGKVLPCDDFVIKHFSGWEFCDGFNFGTISIVK